MKPNQEREDAILRRALESLEIPGDPEARKQCFLQQVNRQSALRAPRTWRNFLPSPQLAFSLGAVAVVALFLFAALATLDDPVIREERIASANPVIAFVQAFQRSTGRMCSFPQDSELRLRDGSLLLIRQDSRLTFDLTSERRTIRMLSGSIEIDAAHDPARPLVVEAGETQVKVLGTRFVVTVEEDERSDTGSHGSL
jgi:ferric-dicitrate binding protein FerR (iron transport regulator)